MDPNFYKRGSRCFDVWPGGNRGGGRGDGETVNVNFHLAVERGCPQHFDAPGLVAELGTSGARAKPC